MSLVIAAIGAKALYLLYAWLASAIIANYLSERKGYGSKLGLALGLLLSVIAEVSLDQQWNVYGILEGAPFQDERALFTDMFSGTMFETDYVLYARLGLSYKF